MRVFTNFNNAPILNHAFQLLSDTRPVAASDSTAHFTIFPTPSLGPGGEQIASGVEAACEGYYQSLCTFFGLQVPHFNVILAPLSQFLDGTGGAFHKSCLATDLYCDVKLNPVADASVSNALVVAEAVEVFEAVQNLGWDCGASNGEGLSRVISSALFPGVLGQGYVTADKWLDSFRPNWIDATNQTDTDPLSNGCAVLFLNWLNGPLNFGWDKICRAGAATLAATYEKLTGKSDGWIAFSSLMAQMFPPGSPSKLKSDNPFKK